MELQGEPLGREWLFKGQDPQRPHLRAASGLCSRPCEPGGRGAEPEGVEALLHPCPQGLLP